jgi:DNA-directed RNA polymerase specialized sigma24 family protein
LAAAPELRQDPDAASELAGLTVAVALPAFRTQLEDGTGWQPEQGASLTSFFIGQCLLRFPNEYRRWLREYRTGNCPLPLPETVDLTDPGPGPGQLTTRHLEAHQILTHAPARTRTVLAQIALGYPHRDIAEHLGTTPKAVEMLLRRYRQRLLP